ncbi:MAG: hypothetical protein ACLQVJ_18720 [Syntrophobacteraceae bacterium]
MNIYPTDIKPLISDPAVSVAKCPVCGNVIVVDLDHAVCDKCKVEMFVVDED